jgi:hypothetical protein
MSGGLIRLRAACWPGGDRHSGDDPDHGEQPQSTGPGVLTVAAVTLANRGDNIGVYVSGVREQRHRRAAHLRDGLPRSRPGLVRGRASVCWPARGRPSAVSLGAHLAPRRREIGIGLTILIHGGAFGL